MRAVMSTLLVLQTTESAVTEIFVLGVKPKLVLPPKRRSIILLSKARTNRECWATTAANARAVGPVAVTGAATAACSPGTYEADHRLEDDRSGLPTHEVSEQTSPRTSLSQGEVSCVQTNISIQAIAHGTTRAPSSFHQNAFGLSWSRVVLAPAKLAHAHTPRPCYFSISHAALAAREPDLFQVGGRL